MIESIAATALGFSIVKIIGMIWRGEVFKK